MVLFTHHEHRCCFPHYWLRIFMFAGVLLITGKQFSDCLTDCVKALGDEELDHTKLFECSTRCNDRPNDRPVEPASQGSRARQTTSKKSGKGSSQSDKSINDEKRAKAGRSSSNSDSGSNSGGSQRSTAATADSGSVTLNGQARAGSVRNRGSGAPKVRMEDSEAGQGQKSAPSPSSKVAQSDAAQPASPTAEEANAGKGGTEGTGRSKKRSKSDETRGADAGNTNAKNSNGLGPEAVDSSNPSSSGPGPSEKQPETAPIRLVLTGAGEKKAVARDGNVWEWRVVGPSEWLDWSTGNGTLDNVPPGSVEAIYASYVLQSFHYRFEDEVRMALRRWYEALAPGGRLFLSVPDFPTLCWLYLTPSNTMNGRFRILQMMMGTQEEGHQVFRSGFDLPFLGYHLNEAGFAEYERVPELGLFDDDSSNKVNGALVSLNVIAYKSRASLDRRWGVDVV